MTFPAAAGRPTEAFSRPASGLATRGRAVRDRSTPARLCAAVALALAVLPHGVTRAAEFQRLDVTEDEGVYRIDASLFVDAPREAVLESLLDFEAQIAIAPPIRAIRVVGSEPDGATRVELVTEICIGLLCWNVKQLQRVRFVPPGLVSATAIREGSDVRASRVDVEVTAENGRTRVQIQCVVQPARRRPFFVPRVWVLNALERQARQSAAGLEALASRMAARPTRDRLQ